MKNFRFFPKVEDYIDFIRNEVFTTDEFRNDPLYSGVIDWIIDHRTPLFFEPSDYMLERSHFTQSFGLFILRDEYGKGFKNDLFYIHDMLHLLLRYPPFPRSVSLEDYTDSMINNERLISNETEILTYVRHPEWRSKTFDQVILYDLLKKSGRLHWDVASLMATRKHLDKFDDLWMAFVEFAPEDDVARVKKYSVQTAQNQVWCGAWYQGFPKTKSPSPYVGTGYPRAFYEDVRGYKSKLVQANYELRMENNVEWWWEMSAGGIPIPGLSFDHIPFYLRQMEGKIIMPKVAEIYAKTLEL